MLEALSPLVGSLIVIVLVWGTAMIIGQIAKISTLKSFDSVAEGNNLEVPGKETKKIVDKRIKIKKGFKIFNIVVSALAAISVLVFVLFMNNCRAKSESEINKIQQAPLPVNFKAPTIENIEKSNEEAVNEKSEKVQKEATEDNAKAMNESIEIFKKAK